METLSQFGRFVDTAMQNSLFCELIATKIKTAKSGLYTFSLFYMYLVMNGRKQFLIINGLSKIEATLFEGIFGEKAYCKFSGNSIEKLKFGLGHIFRTL